MKILIWIKKFIEGIAFIMLLPGIGIWMIAYKLEGWLLRNGVKWENLK